MFSYLHGWKRKLGLVTLLIACLFCVGWMRSLDGFLETTQICVFRQSFLGFFSYEGVFGVCTFVLDDSTLATYPRNPHWHRLKMTQPIWEEQLETHYEWVWRYDGIGLGFEKGKTLEISQMLVVLFPFWSIVIPMTVLSVWLVLSKQNPRKTTKYISEPEPQSE